MGATYTGKNGKKYTIIDPPIGRGGEGAVYKIEKEPDFVLKIFKENRRSESRHRKLLEMTSTKLSDTALEQITWPIDVVYQNGVFVGYVMPAIKSNEDLNVMYSDKYICTFSEKITIARNLCAAINAVHEAGQICGDLNPKNIQVDPKAAYVTLVDTDSYHITATDGSERVYRCEVGMPEYLPREIQQKLKNGATLANAPLPTFTIYSDRFALAVHIFALLMNGCHPFACAVDNKVNIRHLSGSQPSVAAPQPIDNICSGFFPFAETSPGVTIPRYAPEFDMLPQNIRNLFIRAFVDGHIKPEARPDAFEWYTELTHMQQNLESCKINKKHMFPNHLNKCPWCELDKKMNSVIATITPKTNTSIVSKEPVDPRSFYRKNSAQVRSSPQTTTPIQQPVISPYNPPVPNDSIWSSAGMFWLITLVIAMGGQAVVHGIWGQEIVSSLFGTGHSQGVESWGSNLAVAIGPWGFVICGLIGLVLYNALWSRSSSNAGYQPYHYLLSICTSFGFSLAWIMIVVLMSFAIVIIAIIVVIAFIYYIIKGS